MNERKIFISQSAYSYCHGSDMCAGLILLLNGVRGERQIIKWRADKRYSSEKNGVIFSFARLLNDSERI